jgi:ABC-type branched-subunit amino acid transport system permease subunit
MMEAVHRYEGPDVEPARGDGGAGLGRPAGLLETGSYALVTLADLGALDPFVCVPLGRLIAGLAALPISRVAFRLQGGDFAIGTWVITEVFRLTAANTRALGGGSGQSLISMRAYPRALREADVLDGPGLAGPRSGLDLLAAALALRHSGKSVRSPSETGQIPRKGRE